MNDDDTTVLLEDETGAEVSYEATDVLTVDGQDYVVLLPLDPDGDMLILRLDPDGDTMSPIEDEEEWERALVAWRELGGE